MLHAKGEGSNFVLLLLFPCHAAVDLLLSRDHRLATLVRLRLFCLRLGLFHFGLHGKVLSESVRIYSVASSTSTGVSGIAKACKSIKTSLQTKNCINDTLYTTERYKMMR